MDTKTIFLAGIAVFLLSVVGFAQEQPQQPQQAQASLSQRLYDASEVQNNVPVNEEFLTGTWNLIGMALVDDELQNHFSAPAGVDNEGIRNADKSIKNTLDIKPAPRKPNDEILFDPAMLITIHSHISKIKKASIGPRVLTWSSAKRILSFKRDIINSETGKPCRSYFEFSCRHIWPDQAEGQRMLCKVSFKSNKDEKFEEKLMKLANKAVAYYLFRKAPENVSQPQEPEQQKQ